jgi:hypothetical protein
MIDAQHFEVKKHAIRQTADGWVVSFVIHPNDMSADFAVDPLGTRYMMALAEISDDETPVEVKENRKAIAKRTYDAKTAPERAVARAGMLAADGDFRHWLDATSRATMTDEGEAATYIRSACGVETRADLATNAVARKKLYQMVAAYEDWKAGYAEVGR